MTAHSVLRDGMQGVRGSEWSIPFATSTTRQAARKTSAREGCGKISRSRRCAPRHRSQGYDLRRTPGDHRNFASNAVHGGLNQRFPKYIQLEFFADNLAATEGETNWLTSPPKRAISRTMLAEIKV